MEIGFFEKLWSMFCLRPYVFIPIVFFLYFGKRELGWVRTLFWLGVSYGIAFLSEFSSVRIGFPYGWYYYVKEPTKDLEFWITNVPFMDSISYVFLSYWAFTAARVLTGEAVFSSVKFPWRTWLVGAFVMMLADVVIDPVALRGHRWFLGTIFGYPEWGPYFGIPLENFAGWFLVGLSIHGAMLILGRIFFKRFPEPKWEIFSPLLYIAIVTFNIFVALYLKEFWLFVCDLLIMIPLFFLILKRLFPDKFLFFSYLKEQKSI